MDLPIIISNRFIKILGSISKIFSYIFYYIFPKKRFTIPIQSNPWIKSNSSYKIPKIIWQTNYTNIVSLPVYLNYLFNRLISPCYEYKYISTEDRLEFIKTNGSKELIEAFEQLTDGAAQADLWRLFVLHEIGGVYLDIDAHVVWPLSKLINPDDTEVFLLNKQHYTNYFIAARKGNKIIEKSIQLIIENIKEKRVDKGVYHLTGPSVLNMAIGDNPINHRYYRVTCVQGSFTNEFFQYIDKPRGKWTHVKAEDLLKKTDLK